MQNKQQLIDYIKSILTDHEEFGSSDSRDALIYRIALENLTAPEPVPVAWCHENGPFGKVATCSEKVAARWAECNDFKVTPFYAAPFVLADLLPGEWTLRAESNLEVGVATGWDNYRAELLRRINLIESGQWKILPTKLTADMKYAIDPCSEFSNERVQSRYDYLLAAAPEFK